MTPAAVESDEVMRARLRLRNWRGRATTGQFASSGLDEATRFWCHVHIAGPEECWPWMSARTKREYGVFTLDSGRSVRANRFALELVLGPLPSEIFACHACDNQPCCNPMHLFPGTRVENFIDMVVKGRQARGTTHGCTKLFAEDIPVIRALLANGWSKGKVANTFGVTRTAIRNIVDGRSWYWVQEAA